MFDIKFPAVFFQPVLAFLIVRQDGGYHIPEFFGMVHMGDVAEFVDDDIIQDLKRGVHKSVIKGQGAGGRTAAPACFLVTDGDTGITAAGNGDIIIYPLGKIILCSFAVTVIHYLHSFQFFCGINTVHKVLSGTSFLGSKRRSTSKTVDFF